MSCVLTLALDDASHAAFDALRKEWFPPALNRIPAHLSLFHTLPEESWVTEALQSVAEAQTHFALGTPTAKSIGRGVAFFFASAEASALHRALRERFDEVVTAQDRQGFRPHVVVQNKTSGNEAKECLAAMQRVRLPAEITAVGLDLWRYLGGPWQHLQRFPFGEV